MKGFASELKCSASVFIPSAGLQTCRAHLQSITTYLQMTAACLQTIPLFCKLNLHAYKTKEVCLQAIAAACKLSLQGYNGMSAGLQMGFASLFLWLAALRMSFVIILSH
jgi:hypothetical protein